MLYTPETGAKIITSLEALPLNEFFWIDIRNPTTNDLLLLEMRLGVHPLTIEDIQLGESREKCESYDDYVFISVQLLDEDDFYGRMRSPLEATTTMKGPMTRALTGSSSLNCYLLIFPNFLISIHLISLPFLPQILARRIMLVDNRTTLSGDWLAYVVLDEIVDDFTRQGALLQSEIDTIEDLTLTLGRFDQTDMLRRIYQAHRRTTILARLIQPKIDIIRTLTKRSISRLHPRTLIYLRDVQDHLHTIRQNLTEFRETLDRSHDNYLGQSDIELAMAGHRMNVTVKKMTAITFMIGSAMTISSVMGMNVRIPFEKFPHDTSLSETIPFISLLVGMLGVVTIVFAVGRNKEWL